MKSLIKITCTAFILTSLMAACSEETTQPKKSKEISEEKEKNILLYEEFAKGGSYRATVENAKYKIVDKMGNITTRVTINNVRNDEKTIDLSEIKYFVKDEKTGKKYEGQPMPIHEDKFKNVPVGYALTFEISFTMKNPPKDLNNMYLYMDSKIDPLDTYWKLDNLVSK
ncbi:hypothetical protein ACIGHG_19580 [Bacillus sp. NPDC077411]|uniref:DUF4352 domain-containing protein n=1 Tax=Bacillus bruguierae TaxID=3127667 RepID=A0ABU8FM60_9BACI|nr:MULTISPECIES: hypothetical protein [unclassified Bacillus (in: firmicutes)]SFH98709.1 hypothetical protein SAMN04488574_101147 [Bacillus sp. 71mf]SFS93683.1 hypothetical protein SAMN04488145_105143 [Bacillus sp. 103mf]